MILEVFSNLNDSMIIEFHHTSGVRVEEESLILVLFCIIMYYFICFPQLSTSWLTLASCSRTPF